MKNKAAFWDTSALVPLFCHQVASAAARQAARVHRPFVVWWGTRAESFNTLTRLQREGNLNQAQFDQVVQKLQLSRRSWVVITPTEQVLELTEKVLSQYSLSTADGLQLAAALVWCAEQPRHHTFVCADKKLSDAAEKVGFDVIFIS